MEHLRTSHHRARKTYACDACVWLRENLPYIDTPLTISELRQIVKAKRNDWCIIPGQEYVKIVSVYADELSVFRAIPEIHHLCHKYDLYPDD